MTSAITISWNEISRADWDSALTETQAAYQQDWAYGDVLAEKGAQIFRAAAIRDGSTVLALGQVTVRKIGFIASLCLCTNGPVWLGECSEAEKVTVIKAMKSTIPLSWPKLLVFTPAGDEAEASHLRRFKRVMTGEATVQLDLTQDEADLRAAMDGKWRNRLVAAEKSDLSYVKGGVRPSQYRWILDAEEKQRAKRGYRALPAELTVSWQEAKAAAKGALKGAGVHVYRADKSQEPAGAMLFLRHGNCATYHIGWSNEGGRKLGAHNLILWNAMLDLKSRGVERLDLGGVNTQSGAGIARFKLGTGGKLIQRPGVFV